MRLYRNGQNCSIGMLLVLLGLTLLSIPEPLNAQDQSSKIRSEKIQADLKEILRQPEFSPEAPQHSQFQRQIEEWRNRIQHTWDQFTNWLKRMFQGHGRSMGAIGTGMAYMLIASIMITGLLILARIIPSLWRTRRRSQPYAKPLRATQIEQQPPLPTPEIWLTEAEKLAATLDYRGAFRAVFIAMLMQIDRSHFLAYNSTLTNGEYLSALRGKDFRVVAQLLDPIAQEFDQVWYGNCTVGEHDYHRYRESFNQLTKSTQEILSKALAVTVSNAQEHTEMRR